MNFAWAPSEGEPFLRLSRSDLAFNLFYEADGSQKVDDLASQSTDLWQEQTDKPESYRGILYTLNRAPYTMPVVSKSSLPELSSLMPRSSQYFGALGAPSDRLSASKTLDIYVCTHGARDCRCGDIGGELIHILRETAPPDVRVFDIAHVGGHK